MRAIWTQFKAVGLPVFASEARGRALGGLAVLVVLLLGINGMNVINVQSYWQSLVIGVIILLGVSFDTYRRSRAGRSVFRKAAPAAPGVPGKSGGAASA